MHVFTNKAHNVIPIAPTNDEITKDYFVSLYEQYYKNVYNYICFRINNHYDVEDLVSTVFLNVIKRFNTYNSKKSPIEAWLIGIAKNVVNDYLRSEKKHSSVQIENHMYLASNEKQPEQVVLINEENSVLMQAVSKLKEKDRQIISMKFGTDLKNAEIAKVLGVSKTNVAVSIHRSLKRLKKIIEKEGDFFE